jgi:hypothetical protein
MQFVSAPSGSSPITMTLATGSGTSYTVVPGTAFTITPAATTAVQTFVAGTGFTGAPTPTAGQFLAMQATTPMPGYGNQGNGGGLCYLTGQSTLPSGAQSYACLAGWGMSLTVTQSTTISYNYAMQAGDGFVEYVGTAAETMTLPSCVGQSGATYKISNQTSNIITVKTLNSTQPMNGIDYSTTGLALSGTLNTFYDLPNVLGATSGCHWDH